MPGSLNKHQAKANGSANSHDLPSSGNEGNAEVRRPIRNHSELTGPWRSQRILTLDGNGTEGLFSLYVLEALMNEIGMIEETSSPPALLSTSSPLFRPVRNGANASGSGQTEAQHAQYSRRYRPCHYFDCISGTNTGGLIAILLGVLRFTVNEAIEVGEKTFLGLQRRKRKKNSKLLQTRLTQYLERTERLDRISDDETESTHPEKVAPSWSRRDTLEGDVDGCQTIVFTTHKAAPGIKEPYVFRSYRKTGEMGWNAQSQTCDISVVDACRACLASSQWFDSVEISPFGYFRDADILEINHALETYHEIRDMHSDSKGSIQCFLSIGTGRSHTQDILEDKALRRNFRYLRMAPLGLVSPFPGDHPNVVDVKGNAKAYIKSIQTDIEEWAQYLVKFRRERAQTVKWSRYVGLRMPCPFCGQSFARADLITHMKYKHLPETKKTITFKANEGTISAT